MRVGGCSVVGSEGPAADAEEAAIRRDVERRSSDAFVRMCERGQQMDRQGDGNTQGLRSDGHVGRAAYDESRTSVA